MLVRFCMLHKRFLAFSNPELAPLVATFVLNDVQVQCNLHQLLLSYADDLAAA